MRQSVMHKNASRQREYLRFVLHPAEWRREDKPVVVTFELRPVIVPFGMPVFLSKPFIRYQLFPIHIVCKGSANEWKNKIYFDFSRMQPTFMAQRDIKVVQISRKTKLFCNFVFYKR
jgi:hypothetical protein